MVRVGVERAVQAPASAVWAALVRWENHGRWVPLTTIEVLTPSGEGVGARFSGRTGLGPLSFDDPMEVVAWDPPVGDSAGDPPARCEVLKHGRLILGRAWFTVTPTAGQACQVGWFEEIEVAPVRLTRPFGPLVALIGRIGFARMLAVMAGEVEASTERPHGS